MAHLIIGHVTPTTAKVWVRGEKKNPRAELRHRAQGGGAWSTDVLDLEEHRGYVGVFDLTGLEAATAYECAVSFTAASGKGKAKVPPVSSGSFRTAPEGDRDVCFLVGSCNWARVPIIKNPDPSWERIGGLAEAEKADFMIHCGDQIYSDLPGVPEPDLRYYRRVYQDTWKRRPTATVLASLPHYMVLDDHEIFDGFSNDSEYVGQPAQPIRDHAVAAYREYQHSHNPSPYAEPALYYSFEFGRCSFFVVDARTERYSKQDPQIVSDQQLATLLGWLREKKDRPKFVVTSVPFVAEVRGEGRDKWCGDIFRSQRHAVIDAIAADGIGRLVFLTGDMHCSYHATMEVGSGGAAGTVHELMSSPITQFGQGFGAFVDRGQQFTQSGTPFRVTLTPDEFYGAHSNVMLVRVRAGQGATVNLEWSLYRTKKEEPPVLAGAFALGDLLRLDRGTALDEGRRSRPRPRARPPRRRGRGRR
jgi:phosphodiesterase/alkaline phosphatase D-like protein